MCMRCLVYSRYEVRKGKIDKSREGKVAGTTIYVWVQNAEA